MLHKVVFLEELSEEDEVDSGNLYTNDLSDQAIQMLLEQEIHFYIDDLKDGTKVYWINWLDDAEVLGYLESLNAHIKTEFSGLELPKDTFDHTTEIILPYEY